MTLNTSSERVDQLVNRSERIYDAIDPHFDSEPRYRRMLRFGVNTVALSLRSGKSIAEASKPLVTLPNVLARQRGPLDALANTYADVERATVDRNGERETDSRHAIHLMKLAVPYAREFYPRLNQNKVATYALLHDIVEAYAGDVASLGISPEQAKEKHKNEMQALATLRAEYGNDWPEFVSTIENYEALSDIESQYVKTFDKLDPGFTHLQNKGVELKNGFGLSKEGFITAIGQTTQRMATYSSDFPQLMEDREELMRRVAEATFQKAA